MPSCQRINYGDMHDEEPVRLCCSALRQTNKHEQPRRRWHTLYCRALHAVARIRVDGIARGVRRMPPLLSAHMRAHSLCKCSIMYNLPKEPVCMRHASFNAGTKPACRQQHRLKRLMAAYTKMPSILCPDHVSTPLNSHLCSNSAMNQLPHVDD